MPPSARSSAAASSSSTADGSAAPTSSPSREAKPNPHPVTPDGHYFLWRGWQLWRCTNPHLPADERAALTRELMDARRAVARANKLTAKHAKADALSQARARVQSAKEQLGERGPVWWDERTEGAAVDRKHVKNTQYADWALVLPGAASSTKRKAADAASGQAAPSKRVTRSMAAKT